MQRAESILTGETAKAAAVRGVPSARTEVCVVTEAIAPSSTPKPAAETVVLAHALTFSAMSTAMPLQIRARRQRRDSGAMLLAILFMMAMMVITALAVAPAFVQQAKRDREEEMIHRGTEYARAIRKYYKRFGRYPANLEQLENTNQIRFLRQRYKDPLTKDGKWRLLNAGDILTALNPNAPGTPAAEMGSQGQGTAGQPANPVSGDPSLVTNPQSPTSTLAGAVTAYQQASGQINPQQSGAAAGFAGNSPQGNAQQGASP